MERQDRMERWKPLLTLSIVALLVATGAWLGPPQWTTPAPAVLAEVPVFRLVSDRGEAFGTAQLAGRPWLASFVFTSCPGPCPRLVDKLKTWRRTIPAEHLAMVSISVDPETDTPDVLAAYKRHRGLGDLEWTFLTGPPETVLALVREGFLTAAEPSSSPDSEGAMIHGVRVALVDAESRIRGFYSTEGEEDLARLQRDLAAIR